MGYELSPFSISTRKGTISTGDLLRLQARFAAIVWPGDVITSTGKIVRCWEENGEGRVELELESRSQEGTVTVKGKAVARLPRRSA